MFSEKMEVFPEKDGEVALQNLLRLEVKLRRTYANSQKELDQLSERVMSTLRRS